MQLLGSLDVRLPASQRRGLSLVGSTMPDGPKETIKQGIYHFPGRILCPPGAFTYVESKQRITGKFTAVPSLLVTPLNIEWRLSSPFVSSQEVVVLSGSSGKVTLHLTVSFPLPPDVPLTISNHPVTITYSIAKDTTTDRETITLTGEPLDGNYFFVLTAHAFEPSASDIVPDAPRPAAVAEATVEFAGLSVEFEPAFYAHMRQCEDRLKSFSDRFAKSQFPIPISRRGDPPVPDWVLELLGTVADMDPQDAVATIIIERLRRGHEFDRLFLGPNAQSDVAERLLTTLLSAR